MSVIRVRWRLTPVALILVPSIVAILASIVGVYTQDNGETTDSTPSFTNISSNATICQYTNESLTSSDKGKFNYGTN